MLSLLTLQEGFLHLYVHTSLLLFLKHLTNFYINVTIALHFFMQALCLATVFASILLKSEAQAQNKEEIHNEV